MPPPTLAARPTTANVSLISLNVTGKQAVEISHAHQLPDLHTNPVGGLIRHPELALQFLAGKAVPRGGEQIHSEEPANQPRARVMQDGVGRRCDLEQAIRARIHAAITQLMKRAFCAACLAMPRETAEPNGHDML